MRQSKPKTFGTRTEAEQYIAERGLAGKRKARHVGGRWFLVSNPKGTISRNLFTWMLIVAHRAAGSRRSNRELRMEAAVIWQEAAANRRTARCRQSI